MDDLHKSYFDKGKFNELIFAIVKVSSEISDDQERKSLAISIWEISYLIQNSLYHDLNPQDSFSIHGINSEEKGKILNDLYQISNFFSWKKELDYRDYLL